MGYCICEYNAMFTVVLYLLLYAKRAQHQRHNEPSRAEPRPAKSIPKDPEILLGRRTKPRIWTSFGSLVLRSYRHASVKSEGEDMWGQRLR